MDRLVLEAACLFLAGERLNIRVGMWEACKAMGFAPVSGEEAPTSAFTLRLRNEKDLLRVAANLAVYNLVHQEGEYLQVTLSFLPVNMLCMHT